MGAATDADVDHLVVFAHGLTNKVTKSNLAHGRAILRAYEVKALEKTVETDTPVKNRWPMHTSPLVVPWYFRPPTRATLDQRRSL